MTIARTVAVVVLAFAAALAVGGCATGGKTLAFGTATKFGLDVSQRPDQMIEVVMGYDRVEVASIPTKEDVDAERLDDGKMGKDTYSVLGTFSVTYGNPWAEPLVIKQFFATGWAARKGAENVDFQRVLGLKAGEIKREAEKEAGEVVEKSKGEGRPK